MIEQMQRITLHLGHAHQLCAWVGGQVQPHQVLKKLRRKADRPQPLEVEQFDHVGV